MNLDQFNKTKIQIALSNIANGRKAVTPLLTSLFKYTKASKTENVELVYDTATGKLLPTGDRATSNNKNSKNTIGKKSRHARTVKAMHITAFRSIDSDEILDIPEPTNKDTLEEFNSYVSGEVDAIEESLEATREFHCLAALKGKVVDAVSGDEIIDLYQLFGLTKKDHTLALDTFTTEGKLNETLHHAKSAIKAKLKGKHIKGFVAFCGADAFYKIGSSKDAKKAFETMKLKYVVDGFSDGFNYQNIDFVEYNGSIGDTDFIEAGEVILCPIVDGLFCITPTPGKGTNMINKKGQKTYITTKIEDHDVGVELKGQANYICYVEVPDSVLHFKLEEVPGE